MKKLPINLNSQETNDLWSAIEVWFKHLDKKLNPQTTEALLKLRKRMRVHLKKVDRLDRASRRHQRTAK